MKKPRYMVVTGDVVQNPRSLVVIKVAMTAAAAHATANMWGRSGPSPRVYEVLELARPRRFRRKKP